MTEYLVPYESAESEFEEKRSRFISHVFLVESEAEARARIDEMKKKYYDARHNCWCFVLHDGTVRYGDDGEPQGTAGIPILDVIKNKKLFETAAAVVRYFGGVKLGAGGLVRAYSSCTAENLAAAEIRSLEMCVEYGIEVEYSGADAARKFISSQPCTLLSSDYGEGVTFRVAVKKSQAGRFDEKLTDCMQGRVKISVNGEYYNAFET